MTIASSVHAAVRKTAGKTAFARCAGRSLKGRRKQCVVRIVGYSFLPTRGFVRNVVLNWHSGEVLYIFLAAPTVIGWCCFFFVDYFTLI